MSETLMVKDPRTGGEKGSKVRRFDLVPVRPLEQLAEHYGRNAKEHGGRYEARNWERGYKWSLSIAALLRHVFAFVRGETYDVHRPDCKPDCNEHSGAHHLVAAAWHCFALVEFSETHPELDDRVLRAQPVPPPPPLPSLYGTCDRYPVPHQPTSACENWKKV